MSFAPQRPNFVLVWIGIVLLTFSFLSNFLAGGGGIKGSSAEGRVHRAGDIVVNDSLTLPALSDAAEVIAEESGFRIVSDPLAMEPHELNGDFFPPLADQEQADFTVDGLELPLDFPLEVLEEAQEEDLPAVVKGVGIHEPEGSSGPNHALRPAVGNPASSVTVSEASTTASNSSRQDSMFGGYGSHLSSAAGKAKRNQDRPQFGKNVKARILSSNRSGTVVVSFLLDHPDGKNRVRKQLQDRELNPRLVAQARDFVQAMDEVEDEVQDEQAAEDQRTKLDRIDNDRRRELMRMLRLHPGGVEIIAEMTPQQLRALANKLDARSPKLRALVN